MSQPWQPPQQPNPPFGQQPYGQPSSGGPQPYGFPPQVPGYGPTPAGRTPLGQQPLPTNDIARYAPPKPVGPVLAVVAGVIVLVAIVVAGLFLQRPVEPVAPPSPQPTASQSDKPGQPFTMPNNSSGTGRWQVVGREWTSEGVLVQVRVWCDTDTCSYGFTSFANNGSEAVDPAPSPRQPQLGRGAITAGNSVTGYVFLPLPRGAATLILTTSAGRQMSALPIAA